MHRSFAAPEGPLSGLLNFPVVEHFAGPEVWGHTAAAPNPAFATSSAAPFTTPSTSPSVTATLPSSPTAATTLAASLAAFAATAATLREHSKIGRRSGSALQAVSAR